MPFPGQAVVYVEENYDPRSEEAYKISAALIVNTYSGLVNLAVFAPSGHTCHVLHVREVRHLNLKLNDVPATPFCATPEAMETFLRSRSQSAPVASKASAPAPVKKAAPSQQAPTA